MKYTSDKNNLRASKRISFRKTVDIIPLDSIYTNNLCVAYEKSTLQLKCQMQDMSITGCRLTGPAMKHIERQFYLYAYDLLLAWKCEIVWRNDGMVGARFLEAADLRLKEPKFVAIEPPKKRHVVTLRRAINR